MHHLINKLCLAFVCLAGEMATAQTLVSYYDANEVSSPQAPSPPLWYTSYLDEANVTGVNNDQGSGLNAWQVRDDSTAIENPTYLNFLSFDPSPIHAPDGWRLSTEARVVDIYREGPAMGLLTFFDNRRYSVALGLSSSGQLQGEVMERLPSGAIDVINFPLATGSAATDYHELALLGTPGTQEVAFLFDGQEVIRWTGVDATAVHPNSYEWGSVAAQSRGVMRFRNVTYELGPFPEPVATDFNSDGAVDLADYTLWRNQLGSTGGNLPGDADLDGDVDLSDYQLWKQSFGTVGSAMVSSADVVPEPSTAVLLLGLVLASSLFRFGSIRTN